MTSVVSSPVTDSSLNDITVARPESTPAHSSIGDFNVVFADSCAALEQAYQAGLSRDALVRTSSPTLLLSRARNIEPLERVLSGQRIRQFQRATFPFSQSMFEAARRFDRLEDSALTIARASVTFQKHVLRAACLDQADIIEPRAYIGVDVDDENDAVVLNPPWESLLKDNPGFRTFSYRVPLPSRQASQVAKLWIRWQVLGLEYLGYRLLTEAWARLPTSLALRHVLINNANPLIHETAFHLARRGASITMLPKLDLMHVELSERDLELLADALTPIINDHLSQWVADDVIPACKELFLTQLGKAVARQRHALSEWQRLLRNLRLRKPALVLTNHPGRPEDYALGQACRERGIPMIASQHGVAREICATHTEGAAFYENGVADLLLTYNDAASEISQATPFAQGAVATVGMPGSQYRTGLRRAKLTAPRLTYVSTMLYRGTMNILNGYVTDAEIAQWEIDLIDNVFACLPFKILYKPYPKELRYTEPDPVNEHLQQYPNIEVIDTDIDFKFTTDMSPILLTSRATSTVGWCAMSGQPLVFIDLPDQAPLRSEAKAAFERGVFLFDAGSADVFAELREFLSLSLESIQERWREKEKDRLLLIDRFFSGRGTGAGRLGAQLAMEHATG